VLPLAAWQLLRHEQTCSPLQDISGAVAGINDGLRVDTNVRDAVCKESEKMIRKMPWPSFLLSFE